MRRMKREQNHLYIDIPLAIPVTHDSKDPPPRRMIRHHLIFIQDFLLAENFYNQPRLMEIRLAWNCLFGYGYWYRMF